MLTDYTTTNNTVYNIVTEQILAQLETGVAPWRCPQSSEGYVADVSAYLLIVVA